MQYKMSFIIKHFEIFYFLILIIHMYLIYYLIQ